MSIHETIWITWEKQRRSIELAKAFAAKLYVFILPEEGFLNSFYRYCLLSLKTTRTIVRIKPRVVFSQNTSIILASLL